MKQFTGKAVGPCRLLDVVIFVGYNRFPVDTS